MANPIDCGDVALPITIDLPITVTKEQITGAIDLTVPVFVTPEAPTAGDLPVGAGRIQYFSTLNSVTDEYGILGEVNKAATAFFSQNPRTQTLAIAQVFSDPQPGYLITGALGTIASFTALSDGSFNITIDAVNADVTALDFTLDGDYLDIATTLAAGLVAAGFGGATVEVITTGSVSQFKIISGTSGDGSTVSQTATVDPATGTDISGAANDFLNGQNGEVQIGYTPTGLAAEMALIAEAATCAGRGVYGWILDNVYRDTSEQINAAAFIEGQLFAMLFTDSANPIQKDTGETVTNMYLAFSNAYASTYFEAIDDANQYNAMAMAAIMLSVDYAASNSIRDGKFVFYSGLATTQVTETQLNAILSKRGNIYATIGNGARATRDGTTSSPLWYLDEKIGVDNFVDDLLTNVENVFLTNPTVPYTPSGQALIHQAISLTCEKYVRNGLISDRVITDTTVPSGVKTLPAYAIEFDPLNLIAQADRNNRILPGTVITLQLSGSIHVLKLNVNVQS